MLNISHARAMELLSTNPPRPPCATLKARIRYVCDSMQKAADSGVNPFALVLLAESLGDKDKLIDGGVLFNFPEDHRRRPVWVIVTGEPPFVTAVEQNDRQTRDCDVRCGTPDNREKGET